MKLKTAAIIALFTLFALYGCQDRKPSATAQDTGRLQVITTLFPLYDFARAIGGDRADVTLLLPPGVEAHSFEPRPEDAIKTAKAGLFIYTSKYMEPWAEKFVSGLGAKNLLVVDASRGITLLPATQHRHEHGDRDHHHHNATMDPHIWLDLGNAQMMVDTIAAAMSAKAPLNSATYRANASALKQKLTQLDSDYMKALANCKSKTLFHGGHYAFGYLTNRYGLNYSAAVSVNADSEPTPTQIITIVKQVKASGAKYIFSEEMVSPRLTETIARETGTRILSLHNLHNVGKDDLQAGATYISQMQKNLGNIKLGLECP